MPGAFTWRHRLRGGSGDLRKKMMINPYLKILRWWLKNGGLLLSTWNWLNCDLICGSLAMSCLIALLLLRTGNFSAFQLWERCQEKLLIYINSVKTTLLFLEKIIILRCVQSAIAPERLLAAFLLGLYIFTHPLLYLYQQLC